jgi:hypothetical protein
MRYTADVRGGKPIAVFLESTSGVSAINHLVAFYDIHEEKRERCYSFILSRTPHETKFIHTEMHYIRVSNVICYLAISLKTS